MFETAASLPPDIKASDLANYYGLRWFHVYAFVTIVMVLAVQGAVGGPTPWLLDSIKNEFKVTDSQAVFAGSGVILGSIVGVFATGRMCDVIGRRFTMILCVFAMMTLSSAHVLIPGGSTGAFFMLFVLRTLVGIPYGATLICTIPLLTEVFPDSFRGTVLPLSGIGWNLSVMYLVNCMPMFGDQVAWRYVYSVAPLAPCLIALVMLHNLPESPRWLLTQGHTTEAQNSLSVIFASSPIYGTAFVGPAPNIDARDLKNAGTYDLAEESTMQTLRHMFSPCLLFVTVVTTLLYFLIAAGGNTLWAWGPDVIEILLGHEAPEVVFELAEASSIAGLLFCTVIIDQVPRRMFLSVFFALMAILIVIFSEGRGLGPRSVEVSWILFKFVDAVVWQLVPLCASEIFPTVLRGTALGFVMLVGRIGSVACPSMAGIWIRSNTHSVLHIMALSFCVGSGLSWAIPREMRSQPMEDTLASEAAKLT